MLIDQTGLGSGGGEPSPETPAQAAPDPEQVRKLFAWIGSPNIADDPDIEDRLQAIGMRCVREYEIDDNSRAEWKEKTQKAMDFAMQRAKEKMYPWPKASNVIYPAMTTASMQFAARAYPAIVDGRNVVRGAVIGNDDGVPQKGPDGQPIINPQTGQPAWQVPPGIKQSRADRIGEHMSYQLLDEQTEWEPETDKLLHQLPIVGAAFRKSYFDASEKRNKSLLVSALKVVINYHARSVESAPRLTEELEFYPLEIKTMERAGVWRGITYTSEPQEDGDDSDAPVHFLEQHRWLDLDDDDYPEPYVVTVHKASAQVVRIVARYDADGVQINNRTGDVARIDPIHYYTPYEFIPNPEGGIYGVGFGQLLMPLNEGINATLNMLMDAGHLANTGGGFIGKGLSMHAGNVRFMPGEYKSVNVSGATVRESIVPLTFPGPSTVLFQLLGLLIESAKEVASVKDVLTGDNQSKDASPTTTLALIEQGLKVFTAIYKRIHRSLKAELAKLYRLNRIYLEQEASYKVGNEWKSVTRADYEKGSGVEPMSDPTMVTDMQRLGRAQFLMQFATDPAMDGMEIRRRLLDAAGIDDIDKLINPQPPPNPAILVKTLELQNEKRELDLKEQALALKQRHEEASLQLRERHDVALIEKEQANALLARAQAINQLAQADKAVGDQHVDWLNHQLEVIKTQMDALANAGLATTQAANDPSSVSSGTPEASVPDQGGFMPPAPQPTPPPAMQSGNVMPHPAAMLGARQAPDGNHYLPDPSRPGMYLRLDRAA